MSTNRSKITMLRSGSNPETRLRIGSVETAHIAQGNYYDAISDCSRALNLGPGDPIAYFTRGNAHLFSGNLELALADFDAAVEIDPTSGRFTYGRGLVRELMGAADGAEEDYQRAQELGYDVQALERERVSRAEQTLIAGFPRSTIKMAIQAEVRGRGESN